MTQPPVDDSHIEAARQDLAALRVQIDEAAALLRSLTDKADEIRAMIHERASQ